ncbi:MAG: cytochrome C oxidase Cbb3, partial [Betaproteobacteria bacterium]|nr:cytochrome C oxidase Cbb3 [Betaproteobacteria bacterium]
MTMAKAPKDTGPRVDQPTGTEFVGHEWDGIEELNTPLPRWWLLTFYATIIWAIGYTVMFPAWPMISRATAGITGWTSHGQLADELQAQQAKRAPIIAAIAATPIEQLPAKPQLMNA